MDSILISKKIQRGVKLQHEIQVEVECSFILLLNISILACIVSYSTVNSVLLLTCSDDSLGTVNATFDVTTLYGQIAGRHLIQKTFLHIVECF